MKKVFIIGGGPSGMMSAISAKIHNKNFEVIILEANNSLGKKLLLTGGGRCNVTVNANDNDIVSHIPKNGKFLYSSLQNFSSKDIIDFFENNNCPLKEEEYSRIFPKSNKSSSILSALENKIVNLGIKVIYNSKVININNKEKSVTTNSQKYHYDYLIIATGGITFTHTGSDGTGYELAKSIGHNITKLLPAEVPLVSNDSFIQDKTLQGLSFKDISLKVLNNKKILKELHHDLIFTHFGLSGPAALRASYYIQELLKVNSIVNLEIDFLPNLSLEELKTLTSINIPKRLNDHLETIATKEVTKLHLIKKFPISVYSTRGFNVAFVTNGGINIKEIDPKTLKSKLDISVSFCGEIIDYNGFTGGYNLTAAFSTGYTAGKYLNSK